MSGVTGTPIHEGMLVTVELKFTPRDSRLGMGFQQIGQIKIASTDLRETLTMLEELNQVLRKYQI